MKTNVTSASRRFLALAAAVLGLATLGASHARAQANVTFSGGLGTPLILQLNAPVVYAITTASANFTPAFILQGTGNELGGSVGVTGTITYSVNNGTPITISALQTGFALGSTVTTSDMLLYNASSAASTFAVGDTVRLLAGSLTTTSNVSAAPPASGAYQTFVINPSGTKLDAANGVSAAPEPGTWALLGLGTGALAVAAARRVQRRA